MSAQNTFLSVPSENPEATAMQVVHLLIEAGAMGNGTGSDPGATLASKVTSCFDALHAHFKTVK